MVILKRIWTWIKSNQLVPATFASIAATVIIGLVKEVIGMWQFDVGLVIWLFFMLLSIVLIVLYFQQQYDYKKLGSEDKIKEITQRYNTLFEIAKLPKNLSRAVTVEIDPQWYEPLVRIIVNPDPTETPTHLCFLLRTVNRTYHSFRPEEVTIKCVCGKGECSDSWGRETRYSKLIERPAKIPDWGDGQIKFYAPLTNFKDVKQTNLGIWNLYGTAVYKSTQPLIDTGEYATIELKFDTKCELSEERIKLVKQVMEQLDKS